MILFPPPLYINYVPPKRSFHGKNFSKIYQNFKMVNRKSAEKCNDSTGPQELQKLLKLPKS